MTNFPNGSRPDSSGFDAQTVPCLQKMASKFWAHESGASGSDSDSDSDSDSSLGGPGGAAGARRQWAVDSDSESEEEVKCKPESCDLGERLCFGV